MACKTITLQALFADTGDTLNQIFSDLRRDVPVAVIAKARIHPNLGTIKRNAGQDMDPVYIVYMAQAALNYQHSLS